MKILIHQNSAETIEAYFDTLILVYLYLISIVIPEPIETHFYLCPCSQKQFPDFP